MMFETVVNHDEITFFRDKYFRKGHEKKELD